MGKKKTSAEKLDKKLLKELHNENIYKETRVEPKVELSPKTPHQEQLFQSIEDNLITIVYGPPGSGKTLIAVDCAVKAYVSGQVDRLIFTRPCVEAEGENLGFLPGDLNEKIQPYMTPIFDFLRNSLDQKEIMELIKKGTITTMPLAFMRGVTFVNSFVILDEAQNTIKEQIRMFLTRMGENCKIIITGDPRQSDIRGVNGLSDAVNRLSGIASIGIVEFTDDDIVRHPLVREIEEKYRQEMK